MLFDSRGEFMVKKKIAQRLLFNILLREIEWRKHIARKNKPNKNIKVSIDF